MKLLVHTANSNNALDFDQISSIVDVHHEVGDIDALINKFQKISPDFIFLVQPNLFNSEFHDGIGRIKALNPDIVFILYLEKLDSDCLLQAMRLGIRDVVTPQDFGRIKNILIDLNSKRSQAKSSSSNQLDKKIGFISAKGGDGSSSIVANFASLLADFQPKKVLLLDLSMPFGDLDIYLTKQKIDHDLSDFIKELDRLDMTLIDVMVHKLSDSLHLIKSPANFEDIFPITPDVVVKFLEKISAYYEYVLIDLGSAINPIVLAALIKLDQIYLVFSDSLQSARKVGQVMSLLTGVGVDLSKLSIVINKQDKSSELSVNDYQSVIKRDISYVLPNVVLDMRHGVLESKPVVEIDKKSTYTKLMTNWISSFLNVTPVEEKNSLWQILKKK